jgi:hypothetical protein
VAGEVAAAVARVSLRLGGVPVPRALLETFLGSRRSTARR